MATSTSNAQNANSIIEEKANGATTAVATGMESLASALRDHTPSEGVLHTASSSAAESLECGGRYLKREGLSGMAKDITNLVRRHPIPALLMGVGIGLVLAKVATSSFSHEH
jgi:hypothetical protein